MRDEVDRLRDLKNELRDIYYGQMIDFTKF